ncbi:MAG: tRNA (adenosine(37)-N6)-threonylcarbamoyltransferase complex transferase subunit TsaD [Pseudomonadota bacterium]
MRVLGIESSCDETALAVVSYTNGKPCIERNDIYSQTKEHEQFGGVVPELAARAHIDKLPLMVKDLPLDTLDAIAATTGPGLIGGLHIGYGFGRALALALNIPFYPIHHLEGHALTVRLTDQIDFPYLLLLISGGHTQIIDVQDFRKYKLLGETKDDSCGEVFDKTAKLLNLGFPGGPAIERTALNGDPLRYKLPCPFYRQPHCDFSFSGLKTAIRECITNLSASPLSRMIHQDVADLCASIQRTISTILIDRLTQALKIAPHQQIVVAGGVAANQYIRAHLNTFCEMQQRTLVVPPVKLCTDNAAMIAWTALEMMQRNINPDRMVPTPRWNLMELSHP